MPVSDSAFVRSCEEYSGLLKGPSIVKKIFVGNLSLDETERALRTAFEAYGKVEKVSIVTDRDSGQSRGFGFVEMIDDEEGERAIQELSGKQLSGRSLTVASGSGAYRGSSGAGDKKRWY
jgi:cold-inducible RNA-binding protein